MYDFVALQFHGIFCFYTVFFKLNLLKVRNINYGIKLYLY